MAVARFEGKELRPFAGLESVADALAPVEFLVAGESVVESLSMEQDRFRDLKLEIRWNLDIGALDASLESSGFAPKDCRLAVFATGKTLKATHVLWSREVKELTGSDLSEPLRSGASELPLIFGDAAAGFEVTAAIVIDRHLEEAPLRPSQVATWLSKRTIRVSPNKLVSSFSPTPFTADEKAALGLPESTLVFCEVRDTLMSSRSMDDVMTLYVDDSVLGLIQQDSGSPLAREAQALIARMALASVVVRSSAEARQLGQSPDQLAGMQDCLWSQVLGRLAEARVGPSDRTELSRIFLEDPDKFVSMLDAGSGLRDEVRGLLMRGTS